MNSQTYYIKATRQSEPGIALMGLGDVTRPALDWATVYLLKLAVKSQVTFMGN